MLTSRTLTAAGFGLFVMLAGTQATVLGQQRVPALTALDQIERLKPQFLNDPVADMKHWGLAAEILAQSVDGLRKAGVIIPASQG